jgi:hypothetical protein
MFHEANTDAMGARIGTAVVIDLLLVQDMIFELRFSRDERYNFENSQNLCAQNVEHKPNLVGSGKRVTI